MCCQGINETDHNFNLDALALKPSDFCNIRVYHSNPPSYSYKISSGAGGSHPFLNPSNHPHKDSAQNTDIFYKERYPAPERPVRARSL